MTSIDKQVRTALSQPRKGFVNEFFHASTSSPLPTLNPLDTDITASREEKAEGLHSPISSIGR
jgi:hypothetical protein